MDELMALKRLCLSGKSEQDQKVRVDWLAQKSLNSIGKSLSIEKIEDFTVDSTSLFDYEGLFQLILEHVSDNLPDVKPIQILKKRKNNKECKQWREMAIDIEKMKIFFDSGNGMLLKSIAHGVPNSQELALSYRERVSTLLGREYLEEALDTAERALCCECSDLVTADLLELRGMCYKRLSQDSYTEAKFWLNRVPSDDPNLKEMEEILKDCSATPNKIKSDLPELKSPSEKFPFASDAIDVEYSKASGRHIVATRDIEIGELLLIEKPYVALRRDLFFVTCSHCLMETAKAIPCERCINCVYCSEKCKADAFNQYHYLDCTIYDLLKHYKSHDTAAPAAHSAKILFKMFREAGNVRIMQRRLARFENNAGTQGWPLSEEWYQKSSMESVFALMTHVYRVSPERLRETALSALRTVFLLATRTKLFGEPDNRREVKDEDILKQMAKNPDVKFVGGLLIRIELSNTHNYLVKEEKLKRGRGNVTLPFLSLFNHSCYPNTDGQYKGGRFHLYAQLPIKQGEQLFYCYGSRFTEEAKLARQKDLKERFYFNCTCVACRNFYPVTKDLREIMDVFKSPKHEKKIRQLLPEFAEIHGNLLDTKLNNDELLKVLQDQLKVLHNGIIGPSLFIEGLLQDIRAVQLLKGDFYNALINPTVVENESDE